MVIHNSSATSLRLRRRIAFLLCLASTVSALLLTRSPVVSPSSLVAAQSVKRMHTYLGTTHAHTGLSNTHGKDEATTEEVFSAARASGYDFFVLTEHSGPTGPKNPDRFFADARRIAAEMTTQRFVAISGYEYSENHNDGDTDAGHLTVLGTDDVVNASAPGMDFGVFYSQLMEEAAVRTVLAGFNHPRRTGHPGARPSLLTPQTRQTFALTETHNRATYRQAREEEFYSAMIAELDAGWRVAPACGIDGHGLDEVVAVEHGDVVPCRTGILAPSLSEARVVRALRARRVFSTRDMNLHLRYRANERWMGAQLNAPSRVDFAIRAHDPNVGRPLDRINRVEVVGSGGAVLASRAFDDHRVVWRPRVRTGQNTYMLVRVFTRDQPTATALAAPVWLSAR